MMRHTREARKTLKHAMERWRMWESSMSSMSSMSSWPSMFLMSSMSMRRMSFPRSTPSTFRLSFLLFWLFDKFHFHQVVLMLNFSLTGLTEIKGWTYQTFISDSQDWFSCATITPGFMINLILFWSTDWNIIFFAHLCLNSFNQTRKVTFHALIKELGHLSLDLLFPVFFVLALSLPLFLGSFISRTALVSLYLFHFRLFHFLFSFILERQSLNRLNLLYFWRLGIGNWLLLAFFLDVFYVFDVDLQMILLDSLEHSLNIQIRIQGNLISIGIDVVQAPSRHLEEEVLIDELHDSCIVLYFGQDLVDALVVE